MQESEADGVATPQQLLDIARAVYTDHRDRHASLRQSATNFLGFTAVILGLILSGSGQCLTLRESPLAAVSAITSVEVESPQPSVTKDTMWVRPCAVLLAVGAVWSAMAAVLLMICLYAGKVSWPDVPKLISDYSRWREQGPMFIARVYCHAVQSNRGKVDRQFRLLEWAKMCVALALACVTVAIVMAARGAFI